MKKVINLSPKLTICGAAILLILAVTLSAYSVYDYIGMLK